MLNLFAITGILISFSPVFIGLYGSISGKKRVHYIWSIYTFSVALWGFGIYKIATTLIVSDSIFWWRIAEIGVILIPVLFFHFVVEFLELRQKQKKALSIVYSLGAIYLFTNIFTDLYVGGVRFVFGQFYYIIATPTFISFIINFILLSAYSIYLLYKKYSKENDIAKKKQIKYLIIAFSFAYVGGCSSYLPVFGLDILPLANITIFFSVIIISYLLFWRGFLGARNILTQVATFLIWIVLFIRIFLSKSTSERIIDITIFILIIFLGILLMRSILKEVEQKEALEKLSKDLEVTNVELKRLDAAKSEFVSIVSHQLRTPLTAVKGYISMMQEGTYGKLKENQLDILEKVFQSSQRLIAFINDLLNLNRIEDGRISYAFSVVDMAQVIDDIVFDLKTLANFKKLNLTWLKPHGLPKAWADQEKISQVMVNFIDNSIKYTPEGGTVSVSLKPDGDYLVFRVKDTGVGMNQEEKSNLFRKFVRGDGGRMMYTGGTGLGLYVAKLMAEAHHGFVSGESEGKGKGSTFTIKIPTEEYAKRNNINQEQPKPTQPSQSTQPVTPPSTK